MTRWVNKDQVTALTGAESLPITQGGVDRRVDPQQLTNFPESRGTALPSASTVDLATATGPFVHITGTTTITALGAMQAGAERVVVFDGVLTLTHNGVSLILPTGADIATAAGDAATFRSEGGGNWRCVDYTRANGTALAGGSGYGDVIGPGSSVDNTLPRFDGTGGKTLQGSGVAVTDSDEISGYRGHVNRQTGTTYTLQASDSGKIVEMVNAVAITVTLPNNLPAGWCCTLVQDGAGQVALSAASGATIKNRQSHAKLAGNGAFGTLYVSSNAGTAAAYRFGGDTAA